MLTSNDIQSLGKTRSKTATLMLGCRLRHGSDSANWNAFMAGEMMEIKDEKQYPWAPGEGIRLYSLQMSTFLGATT